MTISSENRVAGPYTGNNVTTNFPFTFKVFSTDDVVVFLTDPAGVEAPLTGGGTDYGVTLNADQDSNPGGVVVRTPALADDYLLTITSRVPNLQPLDLTNQGGFYPKAINAALDRVTIQVQQVAEQASRAVKVPISENKTPEEYATELFAASKAAVDSAADAAGSASLASDRATSALASENNAADSEAAAQLSADSALASKNAAFGSETAAAASALEAADSAAEALTIFGNTAAMQAAVDSCGDDAASALSSKNAAASSATSANSSAVIAGQHASEALNSRTNASNSASASATSAASAATSSTSASSSATAAATSATAAATSATAAANSATAAAGSASSASASATTATTNASSAQASATLADQRATWAGGALTQANGYAEQAQGSATAAATSATAAATSATSAANSATAAAGSASSASTSATASSSSATSAAGSATSAANSATVAAGSASSASTSASTATTKAGEASTSATNASSSAAAAATSATNAAASATAAQGYLAPATGTSIDSVTIGTGSKTFNVGAGKLFVPGQPVKIARTANPIANFMTGIVTSYSGSTLSVTTDSTTGSGTYSDWTISLFAGSSGGSVDSVGDIKIAVSQPSGSYLKCDGSSYSQSTYGPLFSKVGKLFTSAGNQGYGVADSLDIPGDVLWVKPGNKEFFAYTTTNTLYRSTDLKTWTQLNTGSPWLSVDSQNILVDIAYGNNMYIFAAAKWDGITRSFYKTTDLTNFTVATTPPTQSPYYVSGFKHGGSWIQYLNDRFVFAGSSNSGAARSVWYSTDGLTWSSAAISGSYSTAAPAGYPMGIARYSGGVYLAPVGQASSTNNQIFARSTNGTAWSSQDSGSSARALLAAVAGRFYAADNKQSTDGITWASPTNTMPGALQGVANVVTPTIGAYSGSAVAIVFSGDTVYGIRDLMSEAAWTLNATGVSSSLYGICCSGLLGDGSLAYLFWKPDGTVVKKFAGGNSFTYSTALNFIVPNINPGHGAYAYIKA